MRHQLKIVGMEDKMEAALDEAGQVRKDFGYPIMVTPLSQFVGTQAAINVIARRALQRSPRSEYPVRLGHLGQGRRSKLMDPNVQGQDLEPAARQGMDQLGTARPVAPRSAAEIRRQPVRRGV